MLRHNAVSRNDPTSPPPPSKTKTFPVFALIPFSTPLTLILRQFRKSQYLTHHHRTPLPKIRQRIPMVRVVHSHRNDSSPVHCQSMDLGIRRGQFVNISSRLPNVSEYQVLNDLLKNESLRASIFAAANLVRFTSQDDVWVHHDALQLPILLSPETTDEEFVRELIVRRYKRYQPPHLCKR